MALARTPYLAVIPAWAGLSLVYGFDENPAEKLSSFRLNVIALLAGASLVYGLLAGADRKAALKSSK
jgi:hypothetical protein